MAEWTTEFVDGAPRLALDRMGDGPFLLFLHGIGGGRANWRGQLPVFARRFHAAAWDARGYGLSDDYDGPLAFGDFADDAIRVLDRFGVGRAHLCGLSMGGRIAQEFAARHPDRVATLVLCDTMSGFDASLTPAQREDFVRLRLEPLRRGKEPKDIAASVVRTLVGPDADPAVVDHAVETMAALRKPSYVKTVEASTHWDRTADLARIEAPTLLVYGEHDELTSPEIGRRLAARIPGARLAIVEGAGHLTNIERPAAFNRAVLDFLLAHRDRATSLA